MVILYHCKYHTILKMFKGNWRYTFFSRYLKVTILTGIVVPSKKLQGLRNFDLSSLYFHLFYLDTYCRSCGGPLPLRKYWTYFHHHSSSHPPVVDTQIQSLYSLFGCMGFSVLVVLFSFMFVSVVVLSVGSKSFGWSF